MKIGSLVYATWSGLGVLAKAFVDHGIITHPYVVRHGHHHTHEEWYPGAPITSNLRADHAKILEFAASVDVMLFLETPFVWETIPHCKANKVKTAVCVMYECMPRQMPYEPDLYLCPSLLDHRYFPQGVFLPIPVEAPWKQRTRAEVFVHNAGHGGLKGRNGTQELLEAWRLVQSPARLILRYQGSAPDAIWYLGAGNVTKQIDHRPGTAPYNSLYNEGDIFIFPERHNGLSLPLQEAHAAGMLVMSTDRFPINTWLPHEPLIPVSSYVTQSISPRCVEFQSAVIDPKAIAAKIDEFYGTDISEYSLQGKRWAEENSWQNLGPKYQTVLEQLVNG